MSILMVEETRKELGRSNKKRRKEPLRMEGKAGIYNGRSVIRHEISPGYPRDYINAPVDQRELQFSPVKFILTSFARKDRDLLFIRDFWKKIKIKLQD